MRITTILSHCLLQSRPVVCNLAALALVLSLGLAAFPQPAAAGGGTTLYVSPTSTYIPGNPCTDPAQPCKLEGALAKVGGDGYTIQMAAGTYPRISDPILYSLTLAGPETPVGSPPLAILDAKSEGRVLNIAATGKTVNLQYLSIQNGLVTDDNGAGVFCAHATLSLTQVYVQNNTLANTGSGDYYGGGIASHDCTLSINNSRVAGNSSGRWGGGIGLSGGSNTINNTTILENTNSGGIGGGGLNIAGGTTVLDQVTVSGNESGRGAGLFVNAVTGSFTLRNSTISGNHSTGVGGGILLYNQAVIVNSTITGNQAANQGGAFYLDTDGKLTLNHVTVADNSATAGASIYFGAATSQVRPRNSILAGLSDNNCSGIVNIISDGHNISSDSSCVLLPFPSTDKMNTDPLLSPLRDNGGSTFTRALQKGSPAIDQAANPIWPDPTQDQRGFAYNGAPDIGAYEALLPPTIETFHQYPIPFRVGETTALYIAVSNPNADPSTLSKLAFTITLPEPLVFADPVVHPGFPSLCGGSFAAIPGERIAVFSGDAKGISTPDTECHFTLNVRGASAGSGNVTATGVSSRETGLGEPPLPLGFDVSPVRLYLPSILH
ncbi:MAG: choice-of-anchor Q domain-containing protein [Anaerolineaceae bacterium]|nr:choice-of-anchor Q domain-containing protein [Anaerolineaceae bacterium]